MEEEITALRAAHDNLAAAIEAHRFAHIALWDNFLRLTRTAPGRVEALADQAWTALLGSIQPGTAPEDVDRLLMHHEALWAAICDLAARR